jgi:hypothetical protein
VPEDWIVRECESDPRAAAEEIAILMTAHDDGAREGAGRDHAAPAQQNKCSTSNFSACQQTNTLEQKIPVFWACLPLRALANHFKVDKLSTIVAFP